MANTKGRHIKRFEISGEDSAMGELHCYVDEEDTHINPVATTLVAHVGQYIRGWHGDMAVFTSDEDGNDCTVTDHQLDKLHAQLRIAP